MQVTWQRTVAATISTGLLVCASVALTQEPIAPRQTARTSQRTFAQAEGNAITVLDCHLNLIDKISVPAARGGVLAFVKPEEGFQVKMGELVAKVKDEVAAAQFATADKTARNDIEIRFAQKSAELAQIEHFKGLQANQLLPNTVTEIEIRRLKLAWERAQLQKENAEKEHDIAGSKRDEAGELLQTHVVESTLTGLVTKVYKRTGEAVREGDPIIDVVSTDRMRVVGYVPFKDVSRLRLGDKVVLQLDIPKIEVPEEQLTFEGRLTFIDVAVHQVQPIVKFAAEVINQDSVLREGATARVTIYPGKTFTPPNATTKRDVPRRQTGDE